MVLKRMLCSKLSHLYFTLGMQTMKYQKAHTSSKWMNPFRTTFLETPKITSTCNSTILTAGEGKKWRTSLGLLHSPMAQRFHQKEGENESWLSKSIRGPSSLEICPSSYIKWQSTLEPPCYTATLQKPKTLWKGSPNWERVKSHLRIPRAPELRDLSFEFLGKVRTPEYPRKP